MTAPTTSPSPAEKHVTDTPNQSEGLDIRRVIERSTSDVALSELQKKGFSKVKVLNRKAIMQLIAEAVDAVFAARRNQISAEERGKVVQESQAKFDAMVQEKLRKEKELDELRRLKEELRVEKERLQVQSEAAQKQLDLQQGQTKKLVELEAQRDQAREQVEQLRAQLDEARKEQGVDSQKLTEALLAKLGDRSSSDPELSTLQQSIEALTNKISMMGSGGGGGGGGVAYVDDKIDVERLFQVESGSGLESNVENVKVKEAKAGGVKNTLAKLKALQQGGAKDGE